MRRIFLEVTSCGYFWNYVPDTFRPVFLATNLQIHRKKYGPERDIRTIFLQVTRLLTKIWSGYRKRFREFLHSKNTPPAMEVCFYAA